MKDIWVPLSGAIAQQKKVDTIANNIANTNTPGFKRDRLVFKEYLTALEKGVEDIDLPRKEWAPKDFYHSQGGEKAMVKVAASFSVFDQGELAPTGNPLDLAIVGPGFLEVLTPSGIGHTRRGALSISKNGTLVNDQGFAILSSGLNLGQGQGENATPLPPSERIISLKNGKVSISLQGEVFVDQALVGKLSIVEFKDVAALRKKGGGLFINKDLANITGTEIKSKIHQGFIEQSNVNAVEEMSELIKANRQFESMQRAIKTYDHISQRAVNDILKF